MSNTSIFNRPRLAFHPQYAVSSVRLFVTQFANKSHPNVVDSHPHLKLRSAVETCYSPSICNAIRQFVTQFANKSHPNVVDSHPDPQSSCPTLRSSLDTCFSPLFCNAIRSFVAKFHSHPHAVAFHPASRTRTHARACTRTYARARDIYADAASNDFTLPSSNRAALPLSFSIIGPPGVTQTPPVRQNPLSDPKV